MNLLINRLNILIIDKKIAFVYVFLKCTNRRNELLNEFKNNSYKLFFQGLIL